LTETTLILAREREDNMTPPRPSFIAILLCIISFLTFSTSYYSPISLRSHLRCQRLVPRVRHVSKASDDENDDAEGLLAELREIKARGETEDSNEDEAFRLPTSPRSPSSPLFGETSQRPRGPSRDVAGVGLGAQNLLNIWASPTTYAVSFVAIGLALVFQIFVVLTGGGVYGDAVRYADEDDMPYEVLYPPGSSQPAVDERPFDLFRMRRVDPE
jgi:hypothetical protein